MEKILFEQLKSELASGSSKKGHPFRYFTLATLNNTVPQQRMVVLRKFSDNFRLTIYTDGRSQKISQITSNPTVSGLFYHPKKMIQLKIEGKASIETNKEQLKKFWSEIPANSRKDYTTLNAPSTVISNPNTISYDVSEEHFCMVHIDPFKIEYLRLKHPNHLRVAFNKEDREWKESFLVP